MKAKRHRGTELDLHLSKDHPGAWTGTCKGIPVKVALPSGDGFILLLDPRC